MSTLHVLDGPCGAIAIWSDAPVECRCGTVKPGPPTWEWLDDETIGIAPRRCGVCGERIEDRVVVLGPWRTMGDVIRACAGLGAAQRHDWFTRP
jgi:hypothetical protein